MKIQNLVKETSEICLSLGQDDQSKSLMGLESNRVVGGQKVAKELSIRDYPTGIETRYSNGDIGGDITTDTHEPGE
jgi:hypothetical protein